MLHVLDTHLWKEHLLNMDHLRQGMGFAPTPEESSKNTSESFELFQTLLNNLKHEVTSIVPRGAHYA